MTAYRKTWEHGPKVAPREDEIPISAYNRQMGYLNDLERIAQQINDLEMRRDLLIGRCRQEGISWRRIGESAGIHWKTIYSRYYKQLYDEATK